MWTWPSRVAAPTLKNVFSPKRVASSRKAKQLKCTVSEGLSLYPVLAVLLQAVFVPAKMCIPACRAFIALADVLDLLVAVPLGVVSVEQLRLGIRDFLESMAGADWREFLHPKFHCLVHLL